MNSKSKGGLAPGEDREKISSFLQGFLRPASAGAWEMELRLDRSARCPCGIGPVGHTAFSLPVNAGLVSLAPLHTMCNTHGKYFSKTEYEALQAIAKDSSHMPLCDFLVATMSLRLGVPWLARQVAFQIGSRLDSLSGLLGGLPCSSGEQQPDLDLGAPGLLDKDWGHRSRKLSRYRLATLKHLAGITRLSFAGDASRIGGSPHLLWTIMEPSDVAAWAPPQAARQPSQWTQHYGSRRFVNQLMTSQIKHTWSDQKDTLHDTSNYFINSKK